MKALLLFICLLLISISGCNHSLDFFEDIDIEYSSFTIVLYNQGKTTIYSLPETADKEVRKDLLKEFSERVKNKKERKTIDAEPPFYSVYLKKQKKELSFGWMNNVMSFPDGSMCQASLDFMSLIETYNYQKTGEYTDKTPASYSGLYWFLKNKDGWKKEYLEQVSLESRQDISLTIRQDNKQSGILEGVMRNESKEDFVYGAPLFELYLQDDMTYYRIPLLPEANFGAESVGYILPPNEKINRSYDIQSFYGTLAQGNYVLMDSGVSTGFSVDKRGKMHINSDKQ